MKSSQHIGILIVIIASFQLAYNQTPPSEGYKLTVTLQDAPFETLHLFEFSRDRRLTMDGKKTGKHTWEFEIPDSIIWNSEQMALRVSKYDSVNNSVTPIILNPCKDNKTLGTSNFGLEDRSAHIYATFNEKITTPDQYILLSTDDFRDTLITADIIRYKFDIIRTTGSDITIRAASPTFGGFNDQRKSYSDQLELYSKIAEQYPDSRYLITKLASTLGNYKSKDDILTIYNKLSSKHKNGYFGERITQFLYGKFSNIQLPLLGSDTYEALVQDSSKFNLIVFMASWCVPCVKEIPLLKKVHLDLKENMHVTYVSIDNSTDILDLEHLIKIHEVPWRTLLAYENTTNIREKYFVEAIPHCVLVTPQLEMTVIDIRKEDERNQLYRVVQDR